MEASISRSLIKFTNRNSINTILHSNRHPFKLSPHPSPPVFSPFTTLATLSLSNPNSHARNHFPNWKPSHFTPSSFQSNVNPPISADRFARILSGHNDKSFEWKFADREHGGELGFLPEDKRAAVTVVVLGWLGSRQKHLRRYAEMYNLFGMDAVTLPAPVNDVLGFHWGRKLESRVAVLTDELVSWLEEKENDGKDRFLIFHTFSNTGWLAYGSILNKLQGRQELLEKIKGCVVDSGGDPELDPKVWAAGFTTALLKKQSSAVNSSSESMEAKNVNSDDKELEFIEVFLLTLFEKFFAYLLELPDIKKRLTEVTSTLSENQPSHPQLYLYSTADKVIPFHKIESFAEHQKKLGKKVTTFNFKSTPHVDHYRTFTDTYRSLVQIFLKDCFALEGKQLCNVVK
ncbi:uncharacterized protein LOC111899164 [Lactuca sativa]|uniref:Transmembrane protein 53 n=1 Tax=Lactuca sativa TaxID=4236 RepID=A0A9R1VWR2_LACSA|nr:uncharacterized protein LOC111899164 [Lactuca sativa]KAJ0212939.1 hypothetical protein LSAT_V11C400214550 [Lactuca sativa]